MGGEGEGVEVVYMQGVAVSGGIFLEGDANVGMHESYVNLVTLWPFTEVV